MKNKKLWWGIGIVLLLLVSIIGFLLWKNMKEERSQIEQYFKDKDVIAASKDIVTKQKAADELIISKMNDESCTFEHPCVLVNPYEISPLTALVIFQTEESVEIKLSINDCLVTTMESSTVHAIPIYGLKANFKNQVKLNIQDKETILTIETNEIQKESLNVEVRNPSATLDKELYFLSGPMGTPVASYDGDGNLIWFLTPNYTLDIEFLKNGHLYLSNGDVSGILYNYGGFVEIDYLGKIYKDYAMKNGYHHEIIALNDGTIMIAGGSDKTDAPYTSSYVYRINASTGEVIDSIDVYDIFKTIDLEFANQLSGTNMTNNSVQYNEETGEMILSLRGINSILSINYKTKTLNWIFGDPDFYTPAFAPYLLKVTDESRYPKGQHTAYLTEEGYLSVFNNDFDILDTTSANLIYYQNNYSSAVLYEIKDKTISTRWEYDANHNYFNYALGSFLYYSKNSKLIDFGWTYKKSAYTPNTTIYDYYNNTYARIMELNEQDEIVFNATIDEGIYRAFKHAIYQKTTPNYQVEAYQLIDNNDKTKLDRIKTKDIFDYLNQATLVPYDFTLTTNSVTMNVIFDDSETVDIIFVGEDDKSYLYHYKEAGNTVAAKINLSLNGNYAVYLKINETTYSTGKVLSFA